MSSGVRLESTQDMAVRGSWVSTMGTLVLDSAGGALLLDGNLSTRLLGDMTIRSGALDLGRVRTLTSTGKLSIEATTISSVGATNNTSHNNNDTIAPGRSRPASEMPKSASLERPLLAGRHFPPRANLLVFVNAVSAPRYTALRSDR